MQIPCACTIAGSDSCGGAGVQADLRAFAAAGVWGASVISAITAQNTSGVRGIWALPPEAVIAQIGAVLDDLPVAACKTGMLGDAAVIRAVESALPEEMPLVVDPVMVATSGARLLEEDAMGALESLISRAVLVTPNVPEAAALSGIMVESLDEMVSAAVEIIARGAGAVLVKGGHLPGEVVADVLVDGREPLILTAARIEGSYHGSGCTLSAAITAYLASGLPLREAVRKGHELARQGFICAQPAGSGIMLPDPLCREGQREKT
ncbi:MAG: bifunctional hydroxymethylpyrimidine kinase/phosphomethylpyrimidine kinase [Methanoculleaceae archaeon]